MKRSLFERFGPALRQSRLGRWTKALALAGLGLGASHLAAMPVVTTITGGPYAGYVNGNTSQDALFNNPGGLVLDPSGTIMYVADRDNNAVRALNLGANLTYTFASTGISKPVALAFDSQGNLYVLNRGTGLNGFIKVFDTFGDPLYTLATGLHYANGIALDYNDNVYITVNSNQVALVTSTGGLDPIVTVNTVAGSYLQGITFTDNGYLVVADSGRHGLLKVDPYAGTRTVLSGYNGAGDHFGTKAYAQFNQPMGVSAAGGGMVVVADYGNNRVKVVDSNGTVTNLYGVASSYWVTGSGTWPGWYDGTVQPGDLNYNSYGNVESRLPRGVFFAKDGTVYTTEDYYHIVRKVTGSGLPFHQPLPPVPNPGVGWVSFTVPPAVVVSVLQTNQPFVFNNDVIIAIKGTPGSETHFTYGASPNGLDNVPDPSATTGSTPPYYYDGMTPTEVTNMGSAVPIQPDFILKAIGTASGRPSSSIVSARFQFKVANPSLSGDNAALVSVTDQTGGAQLWYTLDGSSPTNGAPSLGPISSGVTLSLNGTTNFTLKIRGFRANYLPSDEVSKAFSPGTFVPNSISFGFGSGEASSDFVGSPGQIFYAPVTLNNLPSGKIYSMQFNLTVTNAGPCPGPAVAPGAYLFESMLTKPDPANPSFYVDIPPAMFVGDPGPITAGLFYWENGVYEDLRFMNSSLNLLGVGWLERAGETNLYNTLSQDLIHTSQAHDTVFHEEQGKVILGGYAFQIPPTAAPGNTYLIQIGRPSATSDGVGAPGSDVYIATPLNGSLSNGPINSLKMVTVGQRKYIAGDCAPFRWFNAGDFGNTNLDNSDVMQVFQSAIYNLNNPPYGSDFYDSMDSCGATYVDNGNGYLERGPVDTSTTDLNGLLDGDDTLINQMAFGDGNLDVCDVYVTFRRSLDPSLTWFARFWTNGYRAAQIVSNAVPSTAAHKPALVTTNPPSVNFGSMDYVATPGQTLQVPITAQVFGNYPVRTLMLNLTVEPLDGSPALTAPIQFAPNPALGQPTISSSKGNGNYAGAWLNPAISGLTGNATVGTLTLQIPTNATSSAAYAIHFDHASASPNGLGSLPKQTLTGLVTLSSRTTSSYSDGIPDSWRLRYFGTVYNMLSQATADADGDGVNNWQEYLAGTDPMDAKSNLRASTQLLSGQTNRNCIVHWPSVVGKRYVIERSLSLFGGNWSPVSTNNGTGGDMQYQDSSGGNVGFYRVRLAP